MIDICNNFEIDGDNNGGSDSNIFVMVINRNDYDNTDNERFL